MRDPSIVMFQNTPGRMSVNDQKFGSLPRSLQYPARYVESTRNRLWGRFHLTRRASYNSHL